MRFLLKNLGIDNVDGLASIQLDFNEHPVCVVQCPARKCPTNVRQVLCTAIHLICGNSRAIGTERDFQRARICLVFLIKKPQAQCLDVSHVDADGANTPITLKAQKQNFTVRNKTSLQLNHYHTVKVKRDFNVNSGKSVEYSIDDGSLQISFWSDFCDKFFNNVDNILPLLSELKPFSMATESWHRGNWMELLSTKLCSDDGIQNTQIEQLLQRFYNLSQTNNSSDEDTDMDLVSNLTTSCLLVLTALNIIKRAEICRILQDVRRIFEYITCQEYTVWFLIPIQGKLTNLTDDMSCETFDFKNLKTRIQLATDVLNVRTYTWSSVEHELQDLLIVAFQLAFGFHCKQRIVYLQQLDRIAACQSFQMALSASVGQMEHNRNNRANKNYLQQIIDVCNSIGLMAIIEYPGGLPIRPLHANIIKCHRTITDQWTLLVDNRPQMNVMANDIAKNVEENLK